MCREEHAFKFFSHVPSDVNSILKSVVIFHSIQFPYKPQNVPPILGNSHGNDQTFVCITTDDLSLQRRHSIDTAGTVSTVPEEVDQYM